MTETTSVLEALVRAELYEVTFVMDYVQLGFQRPKYQGGLSLYVWPQVDLDGEAARNMGDAGYRDGLCAFITQEVIAIAESRETGLELVFEIGTIGVRPRLPELTGPEIAQYTAGRKNQFCKIWRPGEPPFDALPV